MAYYVYVTRGHTKDTFQVFEHARLLYHKYGVQFAMNSLAHLMQRVSEEVKCIQSKRYICYYS